jgi:hypothetical protein
MISANIAQYLQGKTKVNYKLKHRKYTHTLQEKTKEKSLRSFPAEGGTMYRNMVLEGQHFVWQYESLSLLKTHSNKGNIFPW